VLVLTVQGAVHRRADAPPRARRHCPTGSAGPEPEPATETFAEGGARAACSSHSPQCRREVFVLYAARRIAQRRQVRPRREITRRLDHVIPGHRPQIISNRNAVAAIPVRPSRATFATTAFRLMISLNDDPRLALTRQPWAGGHNPVGIGATRLRLSSLARAYD